MAELTVLIVGAGETGVAAAGALRDHGFGGRVVLVGAENCHPYARPPLSKAALTQAALPPEAIRNAAWFDERDIELRLGTRVEAADPLAQRATLVSRNGSADLRWDRMLLATGAQPRRLAMFDAPDDRISYLRTYDEAIALRGRLIGTKSLAIVGGGVIGLEAASSARSLGCDVVVIEPADRLMARAVTPGIAQLLLDLHRRNGVDVRLQTGLRAARTSGDQIRLELTDGSAITADQVVVAVGVEPEVMLAQAIGCAVDNGILVDGSCGTSVANVFAAGDASRFVHPRFAQAVRVETWQHARKHGAHAARAMLGDVAAYAEIPWFWTDQHGVNIQVAGWPGSADVHVTRGKTILHMQGDQLVAATTVDNGREMRPCMKLIASGWRGNASMLSDVSRPLSASANAQKMAES